MIRALYTLLRLMGDAKAISRGPNAYAGRKVRAKALGTTGRTLRKAWKP